MQLKTLVNSAFDCAGIIFLEDRLPDVYFAPGELAEWSNAAVLKTVDCNRSWGSNP